MIPAYIKYAELIPKIEELYKQGKTDKEVGALIGLPRRTIGKIRDHIGLSRSNSDTASLKMRSKLDDDETIEKIRQMRSKHSLQEIANLIGSSISAVERICKKYDIKLPIDYNSIQSDRIKAAWTDEKRKEAALRSAKLISPELRKQLSEGSRKLWEDGKYRQVQAIRRSTQSWSVSSIQKILYSLLDDLGVVYYREYDDKPNDPETVIGPYCFDCVIPRSNKSTLLIECHGDYWHSLDKAIVKDKQKSAFINNNFNGQYELKCIWEHEFKCQNKVSELLKYWLGITDFQTADFNFRDVTIKEVTVKTANTLLDKYHYLSGCGRGGILYGAFINGKLIAVCAFSTLIRQNLPYDRESSRELSRFCIHPSYQKKNFGSWLISRCMKMLPKHIKTIISYCDTTFNHNGALYRSSNFILDGVVASDYWYVDANKWVMHKKTLYGHAKKMSMTENAFAEKNGYKRVYGSEKLRFIYKR